MKNIHVFPTDKPSNLVLIKNTLFLTTTKDFDSTVVKFQNIYITSDEEIKDYYYLPRTNSVHKCIENPTELNLERRLGVAKIILTTDQDLIKDGIQAIDDEFLEWFIKNSSCEYVDVKLHQESLGEVFNGKNTNTMWTDPKYKIIIPKEEQKQHLIDIMRGDEELGLYEENKKETLEEAAEKHAVKEDAGEGNQINIQAIIYDFISGAKWQEEQDKNKYSEEEVYELCKESRNEGYDENTLEQIGGNEKIVPFDEWFKQNKKKK
jgi:hypothetical protein